MLMTPYKYLKSTDIANLERVCSEAGTTLDYFKQIAYGYRNASYKLSKRLVQASDGVLDQAALQEAKDYKRPE